MILTPQGVPAACHCVRGVKVVGVPITSVVRYWVTLPRPPPTMLMGGSIGQENLDTCRPPLSRMGLS